MVGLGVTGMLLLTLLILFVWTVLLELDQSPFLQVIVLTALFALSLFLTFANVNGERKIHKEIAVEKILTSSKILTKDGEVMQLGSIPIDSFEEMVEKERDGINIYVVKYKFVKSKYTDMWFFNRGVLSTNVEMMTEQTLKEMRDEK